MFTTRPLAEVSSLLLLPLSDGPKLQAYAPTWRALIDPPKAQKKTIVELPEELALEVEAQLEQGEFRMLTLISRAIVD
jgi:hypothetical protein